MTNPLNPDFDKPNPSESFRPSGGVSLPAEALPPIEPPTGGFIMQLFLIPLMIVSIVAVVVLLFNWLAHMGSDPQKLVDSIGRLDKGGWQSAHDLAQMMLDPHHGELRGSSEIALKISKLLDQQIDSFDQQLENNKGKVDLEQVMLRAYLCHILGAMDISDGVPTLVRAAATERDPEEIAVRRAAIESMAMLAANDSIDLEELRATPGLLDAVIQASTERTENEVILRKTMDEFIKDSIETEETSKRHYIVASARIQLRSTATFTLGVLGGDRAIDRLVFLLGDVHCDVRFNAANALARWGDLRSADTLIRMLDNDNPDVLAYTPHEGEHLWQRSLVQLNALHAARVLVDHHPDNDFQDIHDATQQLVDNASARTQVGIEARRLLTFLGNRNATLATP